MRRRRIKKATVKFLSLVPKGANKLNTIFKADDNTVEFQCLTKGDMEKGELLFCAYAPEHRDSQGDIASAQVIKEMAYSHAQSGGQLDVRHNLKPLEKADVYLAESFLIQKTDERFHGWKDSDGNPVNTAGGWGGVIQIEKEELRKKYRDGEWGGVSLFGDALVETEKSDVEGAVAALLEKLSGGKDDMTPEELAKALEKSNEALSKSIIEGLATVLKKDDDKPPKDDDKNKKEETTVVKAPEFKGDPSDPEALAKHAAALEEWKLRKDVDMSDPEAVTELAKKLAELKKGPEDDDGDDDDTEQESDAQRVKRLEKENRRLRKASNQRMTDQEVDAEIAALEASGLSKEDALGWNIGKRMGEAVNKRRGFATSSN